MSVDFSSGAGSRADDVVAFAEGRGSLVNIAGDAVSVSEDNVMHVLITDTLLPDPNITTLANLVFMPTCDPSQYQDWVADFAAAGGKVVNVADTLAQMSVDANRKSGVSPKISFKKPFKESGGFNR